MNIKEFYEQSGSDYEGTLARLLTVERIVKFVYRFKDAPDFANMCEAIDANDIEASFRGSHTLKGMCANMGFTKLYNSSSELCEEYRNGNPSEKAAELYERTKADYNELISLIDQIDQ